MAVQLLRLPVKVDFDVVFGVKTVEGWLQVLVQFADGPDDVRPLSVADDNISLIPCLGENDTSIAAMSI